MTEDSQNAAPQGFATLALHAGQEPDPATGSRALPIYQTTAYVFRSAEHAARLFNLEEPGNIYTRMMNPTTDVLEKRVAALEGGAAAVAFSSGQSAITFAVLNIAGSGDHIVSAASLYGGTHTLFMHTFAKLGIGVTMAPTDDLDAVRAAIRPETKAVYVETVGNPRLDSADLEGYAAVAHDAGLPLIVDNTMPTPYLVRPLDHGADIVVHSLTKFMAGHGTSIGGAVVDAGRFDWASSGRFPGLVEPDSSYHGLRYVETFGPLAYAVKLRVTLLRDVGAALSPFNAFLITQGIETLPLRMERHSTNAQAVAEFLEGHGKVDWVAYPGLSSCPSHDLAAKYHYRGLYGAMIGFGIRGGREAGRRFVEGTGLLSHLANLGDAKSLCVHPATTTHAQLTPDERLAAGVSDDFVRLSIGVETLDDIIADIDQALAKA